MENPLVASKHETMISKARGGGGGINCPLQRALFFIIT